MFQRMVVSFHGRIRYVLSQTRAGGLGLPNGIDDPFSVIFFAGLGSFKTAIIQLCSLFIKWAYTAAAATAAKSLQSCPTLCDPIDGSPTGSPVPGILQARTLEWVAISFSNAWKWKVKLKSLSRVRLFATPWTAAHQAPPSMGFFQARVLEWVTIAFSELILHQLFGKYRESPLKSTSRWWVPLSKV